MFILVDQLLQSPVLSVFSLFTYLLLRPLTQGACTASLSVWVKNISHLPGCEQYSSVRKSERLLYVLGTHEQKKKLINSTFGQIHDESDCWDVVLG